VKTIVSKLKICAWDKPRALKPIDHSEGGKSHEEEGGPAYASRNQKQIAPLAVTAAETSDERYPNAGVGLAG